MERFMISLVLLSLLFFNNDGFFLEVHAAKRAGSATRNPGGNPIFELFHRHSPQFGKQGVNGTTLGLPRSKSERFKQLVLGDKLRLHTISKKLVAANPHLERRRASEVINLVELPMRSGADLMLHQYYVSFRVGSPPKKFLLIADTASGLTWIRCGNKENGGNNNKRIFHPEKSRTFKPIPCSSYFCQESISLSFQLGPCNSPMAPCSYDYSYEDGTRTAGIFANETVKIRLSGGQKIKMTNVLIGCSETIEGHDQFEKGVDGILGLGFDFHSFAYRGAKKFRDKFSYCLVDHMSPSNHVNYLVFGGVNGSTLPNMQYTDLVLRLGIPFYTVNVLGISVNGKMLDIPSEVWDVNENSDSTGTILDSGMSLTYMPKTVFDAVMAAFEAPLSKFKKVVMGEPGLGPEYCFNATGYEESLMPKLVIHFANGAKLEPPVKSYVIESDDDDVRCLAFTSGQHGPMVIGNIMQQNHLWEFDLWHSRLGFAPSTCELPKKTKKTNTKA